MRYQEELREHARIALLRMLEEAPQYTSNASMMTDLLRKFGIGYTRDQVTSELGWLKEQGLVTTQDHSGFIIATATLRGVDVAKGIVTVAGIQRPRAGS